jgi:quinol monooxygenase YgiN
MIRFLITYETKPGSRSAFIEAARPCIEATRDEPGCLTFDLMASTLDDNTLTLIEGFETQVALDRHMKQPHTEAFVEATLPLIMSRKTEIIGPDPREWI